jgi:hypothetical protein
VYYLNEEFQYLCGRLHVASVWPDGRARRFAISEMSETDRPPWPVPEMVEERELLNENVLESWLKTCPHPEDADFSDVRRHFGFSAPGGRHHTRAEILVKYSQYVLRPVF